MHTTEATADTFYGQLIAELPDGVLVVSEGTGPPTILWANIAGAELTGIARDQLVGRDLLDLLHPDERGEVAAARHRIGRWRATRRIAQPGGTWLVVDCSVATLAAGHPLGPGHVITFRPAGSTMDRWRSDLRLDALLSHSDEAILVYGAEGNLLYASPAADWLHAVPPALGDDLASAQRPGRGDLTNGLVGRPGSTVSTRVEVPGPDGESAWVQLQVTNLLEDPAVAAVVVNAADVTAVVELDAQLRDAAATDPTTGLPNRHSVSEALDELLGGTQPVSVLLADVDRFKAINASFGHAAGDALLADAGRRLTEAAPPGSTVGRFGGDEFVLAGIGPPDALVDVVTTVFSHPFPLHPSVQGPMRTVMLTATAGVTTSTPGTGRPQTAADVFHQADLAVSAAKSAGQDVGRYDSELHAGALERLTLDQEITRALDDRGFELHFQPLVTLATGATRSFEALCRWRLGGRDVAPDRFIPIAEANGAVHRLGTWALRVCCDQLQGWADRNVSVAVNLSPLQLTRPGFVAGVAALLADSGADPARLCFEITEAVLVEDLSTAVRALNELRDLGLRTALDDFGTGWSSLTYLRVVPVDVVKIDKSFIDDVAERAEDRVIVGAVIDLCHSLGKRVVAEGVETAEQAAVLAELGCDDGQGWLYSRALSATDATAWLDGP